MRGSEELGEHSDTFLKALILSAVLVICRTEGVAKFTVYSSKKSVLFQHIVSNALHTVEKEMPKNGRCGEFKQGRVGKSALEFAERFE